MDYRMFRKKYEDKYLYYWYKTEGRYTDIITIHKWDDGTYGYVFLDVENLRLDMRDIEESIHYNMCCTGEFDDLGGSCRASKEDILNEVSEFIPNIGEIFKKIDNNIFIFS